MAMNKSSSCLDIVVNLKVLLNPDKDFGWLIRYNLWHLISLMSDEEFKARNDSHAYPVKSILSQLTTLFTLFFRNYKPSSEIEQYQLQKIFSESIALRDVFNSNQINSYHLILDQVAQEMLKIDYFLGFTFNILISRSRLESKDEQQGINFLSHLRSQDRNYSLLDHEDTMEHLIDYLFGHATNFSREALCTDIMAIIDKLNNISDTQKAVLNSLELAFVKIPIPIIKNKCQIIINLFNQIIKKKPDPIPHIHIIISVILAKLEFIEDALDIKMELKLLKFQLSDATINSTYISDLIKNQKFVELKYIFSRIVNWEKILEITGVLIPYWHKLYSTTNPDLSFYLKYFTLLKLNLASIIDHFELKKDMSLIIPSQYKSLENSISSRLRDKRDLIFYLKSNSFFLGTHTMSTSQNTQQLLYIPAEIRPLIALFSIDNQDFQDIPFSLLEKISKPDKYIPSLFDYNNFSSIVSHFFSINYTGGPLEKRSFNQLKGLINTHLIATLKNTLCLNKSFSFALYQAFINIALAGKYPNTIQIKKLIEEVKETEEEVNQVMSSLSFKISELLFKKTGLKQLDLYIYKLSIELSILWINSCKGLPISVLTNKLQLTAEKITEWIITLSMILVALVKPKLSLKEILAMFLC